MNKYILILIACFVLGIIIGVPIGRFSKDCPTLVSNSIKTDTFYKYVSAPTSPSLITFPINQYFHDTVHSEHVSMVYIDSSKYNEGFTSTDTLRYDSLYVTINDTGNCKGIIKRLSAFGGKQKIQVVTNEVTNIVKEPTPLISLYCGIQTTLGGKWNALDVGPSIQLSLKQKYNIGYSYQLNSQQHSITLQTKIR
jgi:hypothetical protein